MRRPGPKITNVGNNRSAKWHPKVPKWHLKVTQKCEKCRPENSKMNPGDHALVSTSNLAVGDMVSLFPAPYPKSRGVSERETKREKERERERAHCVEVVTKIKPSLFIFDWPCQIGPRLKSPNLSIMYWVS